MNAMKVGLMAMNTLMVKFASHNDVYGNPRIAQQINIIWVALAHIAAELAAVESGEQAEVANV